MSEQTSGYLSRNRGMVIGVGVLVAVFLAIAGVLSVRTTDEIDETAAATIGTQRPTDLQSSKAATPPAETTGSGAQDSNPQGGK